MSLKDVPAADEALPPPGVADRENDPAVVALDVGGTVSCSGTLLAPDVVLTAQRCVTQVAGIVRCTVGSPPPTVKASSIRILVGDDVASAQERARGRDLLVGSNDAACGSGIALVVLDATIDEIAPLSVRITGAAKGDRLRTAGFRTSDRAVPAPKIVRDHLTVLDANATELEIEEPCESGAGVVALDESTGEIVGVASPKGTSRCSAIGNLYARADAYLSLVEQALTKSSAPAATTRGKKKTKKGPIDMGASCALAPECAAGICVTHKLQQYCSRGCGPNDRCPAHFVCQKSTSGDWVCVEH